MEFLGALDAVPTTSWIPAAHRGTKLQHCSNNEQIGHTIHFSSQQQQTSSFSQAARTQHWLGGTFRSTLTMGRLIKTARAQNHIPALVCCSFCSAQESLVFNEALMWFLAQNLGREFAATRALQLAFCGNMWKLMNRSCQGAPPAPASSTRQQFAMRISLDVTSTEEVMSVDTKPLDLASCMHCAVRKLGYWVLQLAMLMPAMQLCSWCYHGVLPYSTQRHCVVLQNRHVTCRDQNAQAAYASAFL